MPPRTRSDTLGQLAPWRPARARQGPIQLEGPDTDYRRDQTGRRFGYGLSVGRHRRPVASNLGARRDLLLQFNPELLLAELRDYGLGCPLFRSQLIPIGMNPPLCLC